MGSRATFKRSSMAYKSPLLSIVIPAYNAEKYIESCVDSILTQTFTEFELIIVDDGSKDSTPQICDSLASKDARIKVVHQKNKGVAEARNKGIKTATGKFITFIDADDTINPTYLSNFSYDDKLDFEIQGFELCFIGYEEKNRSVTPARTQIASISEIFQEAEHNRTSRGPYVKLFKSSIVKNNDVLFPTGISFGEDAIFVKQYLLNCHGNGRAIALADYKYNHYAASGSLTQREHRAADKLFVTETDFKLFNQIEQQLGKFNDDIKKDFYYQRTLEFYDAVLTVIKESSTQYFQKIELLRTAKNGFFNKIRHQRQLPITYRFLRASLMWLPLSVNIWAWSAILKFKNKY